MEGGAGKPALAEGMASVGVGATRWAIVIPKPADGWWIAEAHLQKPEKSVPPPFTHYSPSSSLEFCVCSVISSYCPGDWPAWHRV